MIHHWSINCCSKFNWLKNVFNVEYGNLKYLKYLKIMRKKHACFNLINLSMMMVSIFSYQLRKRHKTCNLSVNILWKLQQLHLQYICGNVCTVMSLWSKISWCTILSCYCSSDNTIFIPLATSSLWSTLYFVSHDLYDQ